MKRREDEAAARRCRPCSIHRLVTICQKHCMLLFALRAGISLGFAENLVQGSKLMEHRWHTLWRMGDFAMNKGFLVVSQTIIKVNYAGEQRKNQTKQSEKRSSVSLRSRGRERSRRSSESRYVSHRKRLIFIAVRTLCLQTWA